MDVSINLKKNTAGFQSRIKIEKKGITKTAVDTLIKAVKFAIPDPKTVPQVKGKDRAQLFIKVDNKLVDNIKIKGINTGVGLVALIDQMTKETVNTPGLAPAPEVAKKDPVVTVAKKAVVKKTAVAKKTVAKKTTSATAVKE